MFNKVEEILKTTLIPKTRRKAVSDQTVRTVTMGFVNQPFTNFKGYSKFTDQHPELWHALIDLANQLDPDHKFSSVTINHNVLCKPHRDARNEGITMIVGLGNYTGGRLVVDRQKIDIQYKPYYFNGYTQEHYTEEFHGDRWTLMFYSCRKTWNIVHRLEDIPIVREVFHGNQYLSRDFSIETGEHWIDIGAHIGCFSLKALYYGATVEAYEPDLDNYEVLCQNLKQDGFHAGPSRYNYAVGHSGCRIDVKKGSKGYFHRVVPGDCGQQVAFESILTDDCCVKMDIEGSEMEILDKSDFSRVKKMVFAYHINVDPSRKNFLTRMTRLERWFKITYQKLPDTEVMNFFPNEIIVRCLKKY